MFIYIIIPFEIFLASSSVNITWFFCIGRGGFVYGTTLWVGISEKSPLSCNPSILATREAFLNSGLLEIHDSSNEPSEPRLGDYRSSSNGGTLY